jgi:hypothetical protein
MSPSLFLFALSLSSPSPWFLHPSPRGRGKGEGTADRPLQDCAVSLPAHRLTARWDGTPSSAPRRIAPSATMGHAVDLKRASNRTPVRCPGQDRARPIRRARRLCLLAFLGMFWGGDLLAQNPPIQVNPNRPSFASPALTTQFGVAELEWGVQQSYLHHESTAFTTPTLLKFGLERDFELRIGNNGFTRLGYPQEPSVSGLADLTVGLQWCYLHDGLLGTDQAIQVTHKFATASDRNGLGSGAADDTLVLLFSRDFAGNHFDINVLYSWLGRTPEEGGGRVQQPAGTISVSRAVSQTWSFGGELYGLGGTPLMQRVVSTLWYVGYKPSSRLVLDAGVDIGLTHGAQRYSVLAGLTYGIGYFRRP